MEVQPEIISASSKLKQQALGAVAPASPPDPPLRNGAPLLASSSSELDSPASNGHHIIEKHAPPVWNECSGNSVAITGLAFRFPGGLSTREQFWDVLYHQKCVTEEMPSSRWDLSRFYAPGERVPGRFQTRNFGIVPNTDAFDPAFFNISAADAEAMDPQQRMFLLCVAEALESSCIPAATLRGTNTGVWVGTSVMEYLAAQAGNPAQFNAHSNPGVCLCVIANRVSFFLGTRGPSMAIDTACASTLTALDLARRAIEDGRCDTAIVGGCNNLLCPEITVGYSHMGVLARDGRCKSFDAAADGYARAEGYGCVVLRRVDVAVRGGCPVLAIVRGSGCNANGDQSTGLTKPSLGGQADLISQTWAEAGLRMSAVDYVEAHGTGTAVGDPIEANAIGATLGRARREAGLALLPIGSSKGNLGHMEPAAALAGLVKACLMIQHQTLLPQALFQTPHPDIDWVGGHLCVLREPLALMPPCSTPSARGQVARDGHLLTIAINSFGFGGSNSHAILQAPPLSLLGPAAPSRTDDEPDGTPGAPWFFGVPQSRGRDVCVVLTAASADSLRSLALRWVSYCNTQHTAETVAATALLKRSQHAHRLAIMASSSQEFQEQALRFGSGSDDAAVVVGKAASTPPRVCLVFSGQGPQHVAMGRHLFASQPVFRQMILECDRFYAQAAGCSFLDHTGLFRPVACPSSSSSSSSSSSTATPAPAMDRPDIAQPAICFYQIATCALLASWGIRADVIVGHSVGEVAAAWAAGRLSLADTIRLIHTRAQVQQRADGQGAMIAVACSRERIEAILEARGLTSLWVAAVNSPNGVTVGGDALQVGQLKALCREVYGLQSAVLGVRCAYHTPHMDPLHEALREGLAFLDSATNNGPAASNETDNGTGKAPLLFSSVTGEPVAPSTLLDAEYWWQNVRCEVHFLQAMQAIVADVVLRPDLVVEVSCRSALGALVRQTLGPHTSAVLVTSTAERGFSESRQLLAAAATCFMRGVVVKWDVVLGSHGQPLGDLPRYPFREDRFMKIAPRYQHYRNGLQRDPFASNGMGLSLAAFPWIAHHEVGGNVVVPGTSYLEMMFETLDLPTWTPSVTGGEGIHSSAVLLDIHIERAALLRSDAEVLRMQVVAGPGGQLHVTSLSKDNQTHLYCRARLPLTANTRSSDAAHGAACLGSMALELGYTSLDFLGCTTYSQLCETLESNHNSETRQPGEPGVGDQPARQFAAMDSAALYKALMDMGYRFGETFRIITQIWRGDEEVVYTIAVPSALLSEGFRMHPVLLDACIHGTLCLAGSWSTTVMPVHIDFVELSRPLPPDCRVLVVHGRVASRTIDDVFVDVDVCAQMEALAAPSSEQFLSATIQSGVTEMHADNHSNESSPASDWTLGPRIAVLRGLQLSVIVKTAQITAPPKDTLWQLRPQLVAVALDFRSASQPQSKSDPLPIDRHSPMLSGCMSLGGTPFEAAQTAYSSTLHTTADEMALATLADTCGALQAWIAAYSRTALLGQGPQASARYTASVQRLAALPVADKGSQTGNLTSSSFEAFSNMEQSLRAALPFFTVELDIVKTIGLHLSDILARSPAIADLIYRPELLPQFFRDSFTVNSTYHACSAAVAALVEPLCAQGRVVRILEVGVRTGGLALHMARRLQPWAEQGLVDYVATDLATTFLPEAGAALAAFPWIKVRRFNLEADARAQGLVPGFDIVVVFSTLHGVVDVPVALAQLQAVMVPGAALLNVEPCEASHWWLMEMWFAAMDVWWRMADFRADEAYYTAHGRAYATCWLGREEWVDVLRACGFEAVTAVGNTQHSLLFGAQLARCPSSHNKEVGGSPSHHHDVRGSRLHHPIAQAPPVRWPRLLGPGLPLIVFVGGRSHLAEDMLRHYALTRDVGLTICPLQGATASVQVTQCLATHGAQPATIVLWFGHLDLGNTHEALGLFSGALAAVQGCGGTAGGGNGSSLLCVSEDSFGEGACNPLAAFFVGFARSIACEMPQLSVTYTDVHGLAGPVHHPGNTQDALDARKRSAPPEETAPRHKSARVVSPVSLGGIPNPAYPGPPGDTKGLHHGVTLMHDEEVAQVSLSQNSASVLPGTPVGEVATSCTAALLRMLDGEAPGEGEVMWDQAHAHCAVPRLHRLQISDDSKLGISSSINYVLEAGAKGEGTVQLCASAPPRNPLAGEIVVRVLMASLNFKDLMVSRGLLDGLQQPWEHGDLGIGCVGHVTAVGPSVSRVAVGDTVVALASRCLATHTICSETLAARVDMTWGLASPMLACILLYATAYEGLVRRARISSGDVVLIHSAASGVGQCAVQLARAAGCVVYATAGTPAKRDFLRAQGLAFVSDSRSPAIFAADVRAWSAGRGVDVVLNSLSGAGQSVSLALCCAGGRFVEIGKKDMLQGSVLSQQPLLHMHALFSVQLDLQARHNPASIAPLLEEVLQCMRARQVLPILTELVHPSQCGAALQHMARGLSWTKPVVQMDAVLGAEQQPLPLSRRPLHGAGACLVTGGLGGVGLGVARMLALRGAQDIVLVSRHASPCDLSWRQQNDISAVRKLGARVHVLACDVSDQSAVNGLIHTLTHTLGLQLYSVIHLAASLADGLAKQLSSEQLCQPIQTKALGAVHLHTATRHLAGLAAFVVTTSTQDLMGVEQTAYVSANTICQQLMHLRRQQGLCGCAVSLGPVVGAGMVERAPVVARMLSLRGVDFIRLAEAAAIIVDVVCSPSAYPVHVLCARIDNVVCSDQAVPAGNTKWLHLQRPTAAGADGGARSASDSMDAARAKLAEIFCLSVDDIDPQAPLLSLGVDSLVATELLAFFHARLRIEVSYTDILAGLSLVELLARAATD